MARISAAPSARDRIVHAAITLFARCGYFKAGTRDIARLADVSEVTLFRHFERKEDLFLSALRASYSSIRGRVSLARVSDTQNPETVVSKVVQLFFDIAHYSPEVIQLSAVALFELRGEAKAECLAQLSPILSSVAKYLVSNMNAGVLRNLNPAIVTAGIALTSITHAELGSCIPDFDTTTGSELRDLIQEYTAFWTRVLVSSTQDLHNDAAPFEEIQGVLQA
jgi:AcrR family transcriptional regulator